jgi:hypothetical protein
MRPRSAKEPERPSRYQPRTRLEPRGEGNEAAGRRRESEQVTVPMKSGKPPKGDPAEGETCQEGNLLEG